MIVRLGIERPLDPVVLRVARRVRRWALKVNGGVSEGMCGDSSDKIVSILEREFNVKAELCCGDFCVGRYVGGHCWVRFRRSILDVTADQFNEILKEHGKPFRMKPIVYGTKTELKRFYVSLSYYNHP